MSFQNAANYLHTNQQVENRMGSYKATCMLNNRLHNNGPLHVGMTLSRSFANLGKRILALKTAMSVFLLGTMDYLLLTLSLENKLKINEKSCRRFQFSEKELFVSSNISGDQKIDHVNLALLLLKQMKKTVTMICRAPRE